ncbi:N-formylglutamate amidohydrolase [Amaricoccus sp.]|uniref:N-formylglutamate amidohydrolase n=1 Tax=Amaricoccus sp. TaxID=1872485 RepID=UPI001B620DF5|nr:N-formylglutamate amidohydrolase [Amaricoccus sp.]MBP7000130.1 N-formylglutamate amidohydrolase [Amaricoccus sp.]
MAEHPAFEHVNPGGAGPALLLCDHASNAVPPDVAGGDLGLPAEEMARHIAWDIGARGVTLGLAGLMDAPALLTRFSRLVIDPNRGEDDPTLVMRLYDGAIVPANRRIAPAEVARRLDAWHRPYHAEIDALLDARAAAGRPTAIVAIHSFTPRLAGRSPRPWHIGVLHGHDVRLAAPLIARLRAEPDLCVGVNQPYAGELEGDTLSRHGTRRGGRHVLIEVRQDLIADEAGQRAWAERLAPMLTDAIAASEEEPRHG